MQIPSEKLARLGVNIDHFATLRQLRGTPYPDLIDVAEKIKRAGGQQITVHLREDKRHIQPADVIALAASRILPLNLEMAATDKMFRFAMQVKPEAVCIVPEKRKEVTTEGGLNLKKNTKKIRSITEGLRGRGIRVSYFLEPSLPMIKMASKMGASAVEIHTGHYCGLTQKKGVSAAVIKKEVQRIESAGLLINELGLEVHAGHGFDTNNVRAIAGLTLRGAVLIEEFNIGHYLVCRAALVGITQAVREMLAALHAL